MSGHSHWAGIKRKKEMIDARRGQMFSRLAKNIMSAARAGGGDPDANISLRYAIDAARAASMPKDSIERAILKGTGQLSGHALEEITYEGYGPGGAAIMLTVLTDSKNRTASEIRKIFDQHGGNLGGAGAVAWMFANKGLFTIDKTAIGEDELIELALDAGAEDVKTEGDLYEVTCPVESFQALRKAIMGRGITPTVAEISQIPQNTVKLAADTGRKMLKLMDGLESNDDVQHVYSNFDLPDQIMAEMAG